MRWLCLLNRLSLSGRAPDSSFLRALFHFRLLARIENWNIPVMMALQFSDAVDVDTSENESPSSPLESGTPASSMGSLLTMKERGLECLSSQLIEVEVPELFSQNVAAKIWRFARSHLEQEVSPPLSPPLKSRTTLSDLPYHYRSHFC